MALKQITSTTLLVLGLSSLLGGAMLVSDPSGEMIGISVSILAGTPFGTFLIPGLILLFVLGIDSLIVALLVWKNSQRFSGLVLVQGMALLIWLMVQVWMIGAVHIMQLVMCILGLMLLSLGWKLYVRE